jgi:hypothetical protein
VTPAKTTGSDIRGLREQIRGAHQEHPLARGASLQPRIPAVLTRGRSHVVYITSLCGLLGWFALARGNHATFAAMLLPILGMGPLRILDGAHWPSDVLAGYALGLAWTITVLAIGLPWAAGLRQTEDHL